MDSVLFTFFYLNKAEIRLRLKPFIINNGFLRFSGAFCITERPVILPAGYMQFYWQSAKTRELQGRALT